MKKRILPFLCLAALLSSCGQEPKTELEMTFVPGSDIVVTRVDAEFERTVDTLRIGASGKGAVRIGMKDTYPGFYNMYYEGRRLVPLILQAGDHVSITADTLGIKSGQFSVKGSEETERYIRLIEDFEKSFNEYSALSEQLAQAQARGDKKDEAELYYAMGNVFVQAKFRAMRQIKGRPSSLSSLSLLYNRMPDGLHLFEGIEDEPVYRMLYDSLSAAYPGLKYLPMLVTEIEARTSRNEIMDMLSDAPEVGFYDIEMPDIEGRNRSLSELKGKTVLLYFYTIEEKDQLMTAMNFLSVYEKYRDRGFEIFQVSVDTDKTAWAASVKSQRLPWINVCSSEGADKHLLRYNVEKMPSLFIIDKEGNIVARDCFANLEQVIVSNL